MRMACASTWGKLGVHEAIQPILRLLYTSTDETMRAELALALVRIVGEEGAFIHLFRQMETEDSTAATQTLTEIKRTLSDLPALSALRQAIHECAELCAQEQMDKAAVHLGEALQRLPAHAFTTEYRQILAECADRLIHAGAARREYLILALHLLSIQRPRPTTTLPLSLDPSSTRSIQIESSD